MSKVTIIRHLFKGDIFWRFCWYHISGYLNDRIHACYCKSLTNKGKIRRQKFKNLCKLYGLQGVSSDSTVSLYQDKPVNLYETPCITLITDELIYRTKGQFSFLYLCKLQYKHFFWFCYFQREFLSGEDSRTLQKMNL